MSLGRAFAFVLERAGVRARLQAFWRRDIDRAVSAAEDRTQKSVASVKRLVEKSRQAHRSDAVKLRDLERALAASTTVLEDLGARLTRLEHVAQADSGQALQVAEWQRRLSSGVIRAHATRAVSEAPLRDESVGSLVVDNVLPSEFFNLLIATLADRADSTTAGEIEVPLHPADGDLLPRLTAMVWDHLETDAVEAIADSVFERARRFLERRYAQLFGEFGPAALALPLATSSRLLRWPRGHRERPHLDPKSTAVIVLIGLGQQAEPSSPSIGFYSVGENFTPAHNNVAYPEARGMSCALVSRVSCRPNSAVVVPNGGVAHAVEVPDEGPAGVPCHALEVRIGPDTRQLVDLLATAPPAAQQPWLGLAGSLLK